VDDLSKCYPGGQLFHLLFPAVFSFNPKSTDIESHPFKLIQHLKLAPNKIPTILCPIVYKNIKT